MIWICFPPPSTYVPPTSGGLNFNRNMTHTVISTHLKQSRDVNFNNSFYASAPLRNNTSLEMEISCFPSTLNYPFMLKSDKGAGRLGPWF